ncbi:uncharacterized protein PGTG_01142 [Puccinia graminis f. sp. tritici CRL 75-36-700-3]|uniref:Uncharacterized protein n=1 Tax=Puccinia graminis f. sp. tritici (strain CRL 75-36-700-3 / race SCCL) TaxID=418459 RepID=E3JUT6_PUCGT|nr:uncharacterized protein PGTG_01142 [Puccinia graminis f. sp. tritici CRL 75-36-700-3]EFP75811.1 hypothetical protein PGTG_01142 [Puccinia graminis f. sp. tritici CRL 75-36-700-3]
MGQPGVAFQNEADISMTRASSFVGGRHVAGSLSEHCRARSATLPAKCPRADGHEPEAKRDKRQKKNPTAKKKPMASTEMAAPQSQTKEGESLSKDLPEGIEEGEGKKKDFVEIVEEEDEGSTTKEDEEQVDSV